MDTDDEKDPTERWYLISANKTSTVMWDVLMYLITVYSLFATPFM